MSGDGTLLAGPYGDTRLSLHELRDRSAPDLPRRLKRINDIDIANGANSVLVGAGSTSGRRVESFRLYEQKDGLWLQSSAIEREEGDPVNPNQFARDVALTQNAERAVIGQLRGRRVSDFDLKTQTPSIEGTPRPVAVMGQPYTAFTSLSGSFDANYFLSVADPDPVDQDDLEVSATVGGESLLTLPDGWLTVDVDGSQTGILGQLYGTPPLDATGLVGDLVVEVSDGTLSASTGFNLRIPRFDGDSLPDYCDLD